MVPVPETAPATEEEPGEAAERVRAAVAELLCGFPVYRSYLPEGRSALETAVSVARAHRPDLAEVLATIRDTMLAVRSMKFLPAVSLMIEASQNRRASTTVYAQAQYARDIPNYSVNMSGLP